MHLLEALNPVAQQRGELNVQTINERPTTLDGKTVGLVWSGTHGGDWALNRVGEMLTERFDDIDIKFYIAGGYPVPPTILAQAGEECDVVVGATGD